MLIIVTHIMGGGGGGGVNWQCTLLIGHVTGREKLSPTTVPYKLCNVLRNLET